MSSDEQFIQDLKGSQGAVYRSAQYLNEAGFPVMINPLRIRPKFEDRAAFSDNGDLHALLTFEVKHRKIKFTGASDYPYPTVFVDTASRFDRKSPGIERHGCKVFGTFVCGGGSTMGYKLAGFDHLGGVEIDPKVAEVYRINHSPRYFYIQDIREFNKRTDLPPELYNLDLLDGSPPCSSFSMAGNREKDWGKKKQFREGQELQRLDDLVFEYIRTIIAHQIWIQWLNKLNGN